MKKFFIYIFLVTVLLCGCDKIEEDDRNIPVENIKAQRPVLLEDFTGQNCPNCPEAASRAAALKEALKENLIIVSIHTGPFSTRSYRTDAGTAYQEKFYPSNGAYPFGMIDRCEFDGDRISTTSSKWGSYVLNRSQLEIVEDLSLSLSCQYEEEENRFTVNSLIKGETNMEIMLQLWLTESKIIDWQKDGTVIMEYYEHNHVLRDAINGIWGQTVEIENIEGTSVLNSYDLSDKSWNHENLSVVGFLYNASTFEVLYTTEVSLLNN